MSENTVYKLVLYPKNVDFVPESWNEIRNCLLQLGFIGQAIENQNNNYFVGDEFLRLITFLGCSPSIQLQAEDDGDDKFCRIVFSELHESVQFRFFQRDVSARCPSCRKKMKSWASWLAQWQESGKTALGQCQSCGENLSLFELDWKHSAAFARCFIEVLNIYPQEAIPTEELLSALFECTGFSWDYVFID